MRHRILRWLAPLFLAAACCLPAAQAAPFPPLLAQEDTSSSSDTGQKVPAFQYFFASLSLIIVLVILCTPSRKREKVK